MFREPYNPVSFKYSPQNIERVNKFNNNIAEKTPREFIFNSSENSYISVQFQVTQQTEEQEDISEDFCLVNFELVLLFGEAELTAESSKGSGKLKVFKQLL